MNLITAIASSLKNNNKLKSPNIIENIAPRIQELKEDLEVTFAIGWNSFYGWKSLQFG